MQLKIFRNVKDISMRNQGRLSYTPLSRFHLLDKDAFPVLSWLNMSGLSREPWSRVKSIVDNVYKHICGQANFTEIKFLLEQNSTWNDAGRRYVSLVF